MKTSLFTEFILDIVRMTTKTFLIVSVVYFSFSLVVRFMPKIYSTQLNRNELIPLEENIVNNNPKTKSIVMIESVLGFCSGAIIDSNYVLTAAHCVVNDNNIMYKGKFIVHEFTSNDTNDIVATAVALDLERDVALIKGNFSKSEKISVDWDGKELTKVFMNEYMMGCGFPAGSDHLLCSFFKFNGNDFFLIRGTGGTLQKGMSGGPVIGPSGKIIGVNSRVTQDSALFGPVVGLDKLFDLKKK